MTVSETKRLAKHTQKTNSFHLTRKSENSLRRLIVLLENFLINNHQFQYVRWSRLEVVDGQFHQQWKSIAFSAELERRGLWGVVKPGSIKNLPSTIECSFRFFRKRTDLPTCFSGRKNILYSFPIVFLSQIRHRAPGKRWAANGQWAKIIGLRF